jgi:predicted metalloprotease
MRWQGREAKPNIEDRRSSGSRGVVASGGIGLLAVLAIGYFLGIDLTPFWNSNSSLLKPNVELTEADVQAGEFVSVVLNDTEEIWSGIFQQQIGQSYTPTTLVLYKGVTQSACGGASGATGPFYCPGDRQIYLDTDFFVTLSQSGSAPAGISRRPTSSPTRSRITCRTSLVSCRRPTSSALAIERGGVERDLGPMIELQADCFAGIWARHVEEQFGTLEAGDVEEAMNAARQIGDDTLQRNAGPRSDAAHLHAWHQRTTPALVRDRLSDWRP